MSTHIDAALAAALPAPEAGLALAQHLTADDPVIVDAAHHTVLDVMARTHQRALNDICDDLNALADANKAAEMAAAAIEGAL